MPLSIAEPTASWRCDIRSVSAPPMNDEMTRGATVAAATSPILPALPVVWSTNQGTASMVMLLPRLEMRLAASIQYTGQDLGEAVAGWLSELRSAGSMLDVL